MVSAEFDLSTAALVLVDLYNGLLGIDLQPYSGEEVLANGVALAEHFRARDGLVVLTAPALNAPPSDLYARPAPTALFERDMSPLAGVAAVVNWSEIPEQLGPRPGDHIIRKSTWSAFFGTDLDLQLRRRGVDTLILGGIATNFGAEGTGRDARALGYRVIFVEDVMRAITAEEHRHSVEYTLPTIGRVWSTKQVLDRS